MSSEGFSGEERKSSPFDADIFYGDTLPEESEVLTSGPINEDVLGGADELQTASTNTKPSKCKGEYIVGGIIFICALLTVLISVIVVATSKDGNNLLIQFDDIFNSSFKAFTATPQWLNDTSFVWVDQNNSIFIHHCDSNSSRLLMAFNVTFLGSDFTDYSPSPDGKLLLVEMDSQKVWRHSRRSTFIVFDPDSGSKLTIGSDSVVALALWSPAYGEDEQYMIAYVMGNDLYVDVFQRRPQLSLVETIRVTSDGNETILNGLNGWLYEEEVLSGGIKPVWWSPDGKYLSWIRSDESSVMEYSFPVYDSEMIYPSEKVFRYPKPGTTNPKVQLLIFSLKDNSTRRVNQFSRDDHYITYVAWVPPMASHNVSEPAMLVKWTTRAQNVEYNVRVTPDAKTKELFHRSRAGWVATHPVFVLGKSGYFIDLQPDDDVLQLALYDAISGSFVRWLTNEKYEVVSCLGYDPDSQLVYYQAAPTPLTRHLFSVSLLGSSPTQLTAPETGSWWSASVSPGGKWMVVTNGGPKIPTQSLTNTKLQTMQDFQKNEALTNLLKKYDMPVISYVTAPAANEKDMLHGFIIMPPKSLRKKTNPVVFTVYGGPGSQTVTKAWYSDMFHLYLASEGYYVVGVDGRGTGFRGETFMKQIYMKMGVMETEDQIAAARYLKENNDNWGDMAIWGWSFGGYMVSRVMTHPNHSDVFPYGIAVAPPVDWRYYDSAYTERYMNLPKFNKDGYVETSVLPNVGNMKPNTFLLIHGTADDNVHFMNSALLNDALVAKDIPFETMYYVNRDHSINVGNSRRHLYRLIKRFLDKKLKPDTFVENPDLE